MKQKNCKCKSILISWEDLYLLVWHVLIYWVRLLFTASTWKQWGLKLIRERSFIDMEKVRQTSQSQKAQTASILKFVHYSNFHKWKLIWRCSTPCPSMTKAYALGWGTSHPPPQACTPLLHWKTPLFPFCIHVTAWTRHAQPQGCSRDTLNSGGLHTYLLYLMGRSTLLWSGSISPDA